MGFKQETFFVFRLLTSIFWMLNCNSSKVLKYGNTEFRYILCSKQDPVLGK